MQCKRIVGACACFLLIFGWGNFSQAFAQAAKAAPALKSAVTSKPVSADAATSAGKAPQVLLHWITQSEEDNYGFSIERSDSEKGPYKQITKTVIAGHGTTSTPHDYNYVDYDVKVGKLYFYRLYTITYQGQRTLMGEIRHKAKDPNEK